MPERWAWLGGAEVHRCRVIYAWDPPINGYAGRVELIDKGRPANAVAIHDTRAAALRRAEATTRADRERLERELTTARANERQLRRELTLECVMDLPFDMES